MGEQNKKYLIFDLDEVILDVMKEFDGNKEKLPNEEMANLEKEDLLDNYLNCLGEIFQINIITNAKTFNKNNK